MHLAGRAVSPPQLLLLLLLPMACYYPETGFPLPTATTTTSTTAMNNNNNHDYYYYHYDYDADYYQRWNNHTTATSEESLGRRRGSLACPRQTSDNSCWQPAFTEMQQIEVPSSPSQRDHTVVAMLPMLLPRCH